MRRLAGWMPLLLTAAACLLSVMIGLFLRWSFENEAKSSSPGSKPSPPGNAFVEPNQNDVVLEEQDNEALVDSTVRDAGTARIANGNTRTETATVEIETVSRPLAFYEPAPGSNWSNEQLQRLDVLRNEFVAAVGGWNQDPNNSAYRERWMRAQPLIDEQFETIFGVEAFSERQIQAVHQRE